MIKNTYGHYWQISLLTEILGRNRYVHHVTVYEKGITDGGDAETSTLTDLFCWCDNTDLLYFSLHAVSSCSVMRTAKEFSE